MRIRHLMALALLIASSALGKDYYTTTVSPGKKINFSAGESQSAVVRPGVKPQCPNGRIVITDDWRRPPLFAGDAPSFDPTVTSLTADVAHWQNVPGPAPIKAGLPTSGTSVFKPVPFELEPKNGKIGLRKMRVGIWNADHRLISLPNGDLIYQRGAASAEPMTPEPRWAPFTNRALGTGFFGPAAPMQFGPGTRSTNLTWRSTDCGMSFEYIGEIDSYGPQHEDCASPQAIKGDIPPWDMGGTDGPNLIAGAKGTVYALIPCFGRNLHPQFNILTSFVQKTYIFSWNGISLPSDMSKLFTVRGFFQSTIWGAPAVALSPTRMVVAINDNVMAGNAATPAAPFTFPQIPQGLDHPDGVFWGWSGGEDIDSPQTEYTAVLDGIKHGTTLLARMPGQPSAVLFAFPSRIDDANGFRVFRYDPDRPASTRFKEIETIVPPAPADKNAVVYLTAVDPGDNGPVLLYWMELTNDPAPKAKVRGLVIFDDVNRAAVDLTDNAFTLTAPAGSPYWFGDYHTAEAFKVSAGDGVDVYHYFPMWPQPWTTPSSAGQPGGSAHYREVVVTRKRLADLINKKPREIVLAKCCDLMPLIETIEREHGLASISASSARNADEAQRFAVVSALLAADPNLRDRAARASLLPARDGVTRRAVAPLKMPDTREQAEEHLKRRP